MSRQCSVVSPWSKQAFHGSHMNLICTKIWWMWEVFRLLQGTLLVFIRSTPPPLPPHRRRPLSTSVKYVLTHVVSRCLLPRVEQPTLSFLIELKPARQLIWRWLTMISHTLIKAPASNMTLCFNANLVTQPNLAVRSLFRHCLFSRMSSTSQRNTGKPCSPCLQRRSGRSTAARRR